MSHNNNSGFCLDCSSVIFFQPSRIRFHNPLFPWNDPINHGIGFQPNGHINAAFWNEESFGSSYPGNIARRGNKFWIKKINPNNLPCSQFHGWEIQIDEWEILADCNVSPTRSWTLPSHVKEHGLMNYVTSSTTTSFNGVIWNGQWAGGSGGCQSFGYSTGIGMCATNQISAGWQVLSAAGVLFDHGYLTSIGRGDLIGKPTIAKIGVPPANSNDPIDWRPIHKLKDPYHLASFGSLVYIPTTNTHVTVMEVRHDSPEAWARQYDSNGNVIGECIIPEHIYNPGMVSFVNMMNATDLSRNLNVFTYGSNVYMTLIGNHPVSVYKLDLSNFTISQTPEPDMYGLGGYDMAVDPDCWFTPPVYPSSWDCVQIGDHPKFGHKCIEIHGLSGQYETEQECINSGCKEINPDPGVPTSNIGQQGPSPVTGSTGGGTGGGTVGYSPSGGSGGSSDDSVSGGTDLSVGGEEGT